MAKGALGPAVGAGVCANAMTQLATRKTAAQNTLVIIKQAFPALPQTLPVGLDCRPRMNAKEQA
jgi:F0F1-type ATP synthase membrane subunit c/vacuolar-type H+-ATPase subunit K